MELNLSMKWGSDMQFVSPAELEAHLEPSRASGAWHAFTISDNVLREISELLLPFAMP